MTFYNIHTHHFDKNNPCVLNCFPTDYINVKKQYPNAMVSVGIHPWYIRENGDDELDVLEKLIQAENIVAIGECGLDGVCNVDKELQERVFIQQIELSENYHKPLIIHSVKMNNQLIRLKKQCKPQMPWIVHGYRGNKQETIQLLQHGFFFSFGNSILAESLLVIPISRIFAETDDASIQIDTIYQKIAEALNMDISLLAKTIEGNFLKIFK